MNDMQWSCAVNSSTESSHVRHVTHTLEIIELICTELQKKTKKRREIIEWNVICTLHSAIYSCYLVNYLAPCTRFTMCTTF